MRHRWIRHRWRSAADIARSTASISPPAPSEMASSGQVSLRSPSSVGKALPPVPGLHAAGRGQTDEHGLAGLPSVSIPHAAGTGSAAAPTWYRKQKPSRNRELSGSSQSRV